MAASYCFVGDSIHVQADAVEEAYLKELAKKFPVKKIPYAGERVSLKFDRRQWRPSRGIGKELTSARLSWTDYATGMHIKQFATANEMRLLYTPEFSKNEEHLKLVVAQEGYSYAMSKLAGIKGFYGGTERVPQGFVRNREALESLCRKATEVARAEQDISFRMYRHCQWNDAHGGYVALRSAVAYRAWRQSQDAHTIAKDMGLTWRGVRQMLRRLCESARKLGLETFPRHHSCFNILPRPYDYPFKNRGGRPKKLAKLKGKSPN